LRQCLQGIDGLGLEVGSGRRLAGPDRLEVVAGTERTTGAGENHHADLVGVLGDVVQVLPQFDEQGRAERVQGLRSIEGEGAAALVVVAQNQFRHDGSLPEVGGR